MQRKGIQYGGGILLAAILLGACASDLPDRLVGDWTAISVTENGSELTLDPAEVQFHFGPEGRYRYESTLDYQEAGYYRIVDEYLLSRDTLTAQTEEKAVKISLSPSADTLTMDMEFEGRPQQIVLVRE
jgi:hypothetical protein